MEILHFHRRVQVLILSLFSFVGKICRLTFVSNFSSRISIWHTFVRIMRCQLWQMSCNYAKVIFECHEIACLSWESIDVIQRQLNIPIPLLLFLSVSIEMRLVIVLFSLKLKFLIVCWSSPSLTAVIGFIHLVVLAGLKRQRYTYLWSPLSDLWTDSSSWKSFWNAWSSPFGPFL